MNNIKSIESITEQELGAGIYGGISKGSWHEKYKDSAWIFLGGFSYELSEGDLICVLSQFGEIQDINLVRDKETGKSKGFAFIKYEDQRSTILAVDNFNGVRLLNRIIRCDHVDQYKLPKDIREAAEKELDHEESVDIGAGHAYKNKELENDHNIFSGVDVWAKPVISNSNNEIATSIKNAKKDKKKKHEEHKKKLKDKHKRSKHSDDNNNSSNGDYHGKRYRGSDFVASSSRSKETTTETDAGASVMSWRGRRDPTLNSSNNNDSGKRQSGLEKPLVSAEDRSTVGIAGRDRTR